MLGSQTLLSIVSLGERWFNSWAMASARAVSLTSASASAARIRAVWLGAEVKAAAANLRADSTLPYSASQSAITAWVDVAFALRLSRRSAATERSLASRALASFP